VGLQEGVFFLDEYAGFQDARRERLVILAPDGANQVCTLTPDDDSYEEDLFAPAEVLAAAAVRMGLAVALGVAAAPNLMGAGAGPRPRPGARAAAPPVAAVAMAAAGMAPAAAAPPGLLVAEPPAAAAACAAPGGVGGVAGLAAALAFPLAGAAAAAPAAGRLRPSSGPPRPPRHRPRPLTQPRLQLPWMRGRLDPWVLKFMEAHGGAPTGRHSRWMSETRLQGHELGVDEHERARRALERMVVRDQLNVANLASEEMLARTVQLQEKRYRDRLAPAVDSSSMGSHLLLGSGQLRGNARASPPLQDHCRDELAKTNACRLEQRRAREERDLAHQTEKGPKGDKTSCKDDK
ncbi:unnamed protein product, partial [Prorocentrum cordatum]